MYGRRLVYRNNTSCMEHRHHTKIWKNGKARVDVVAVQEIRRKRSSSAGSEKMDSVGGR